MEKNIFLGILDIKEEQKWYINEKFDEIFTSFLSSEFLENMHKGETSFFTNIINATKQYKKDEKLKLFLAKLKAISTKSKQESKMIWNFLFRFSNYYYLQFNYVIKFVFLSHSSNKDIMNKLLANDVFINSNTKHYSMIEEINNNFVCNVDNARIPFDHVGQEHLPQENAHFDISKEEGLCSKVHNTKILEENKNEKTRISQKYNDKIIINFSTWLKWIDKERKNNDVSKIINDGIHKRYTGHRYTFSRFFTLYFEKAKEKNYFFIEEKLKTIFEKYHISFEVFEMYCDELEIKQKIENLEDSYLFLLYLCKPKKANNDLFFLKENLNIIPKKISEFIAKKNNLLIDYENNVTLDKDFNYTLLRFVKDNYKNKIFDIKEILKKEFNVDYDYEESRRYKAFLERQDGILNSNSGKYFYFSDFFIFYNENFKTIYKYMTNLKEGYYSSNKIYTHFKLLFDKANLHNIHSIHNLLKKFFELSKLKNNNIFFKRQPGICVGINDQKEWAINYCIQHNILNVADFCRILKNEYGHDQLSIHAFANEVFDQLDWINSNKPKVNKFEKEKIEIFLENKKVLKRVDFESFVKLNDMNYSIVNKVVLSGFGWVLKDNYLIRRDLNIKTLILEQIKNSDNVLSDFSELFEIDKSSTYNALLKLVQSKKLIKINEAEFISVDKLGGFSAYDKIHKKIRDIILNLQGDVLNIKDVIEELKKYDSLKTIKTFVTNDFVMSFVYGMIRSGELIISLITFGQKISLLVKDNVNSKEEFVIFIFKKYFKNETKIKITDIFKVINLNFIEKIDFLDFQDNLLNYYKWSDNGVYFNRDLLFFVLKKK